MEGGGGEVIEDKSGSNGGGGGRLVGRKWDTPPGMMMATIKYAAASMKVAQNGVEEAVEEEGFLCDCTKRGERGANFDLRGINPFTPPALKKIGNFLQKWCSHDFPLPTEVVSACRSWHCSLS